VQRKLSIIVILLVACACSVLYPRKKKAKNAEEDEPKKSDLPQETSTASPSPAAICNPKTGWPAPLSTCSEAEPCDVPEGADIGAESNIPQCKTPDTVYGQKHVFFDDSPAKQATDSNGLTRYYCEYRPVGTSLGSKRPLVLWFHGGSGNADNVYEFSRMREKAENYDLTADTARSGFILVSIQSRNLRWPTSEIKHGPHHDFYYRDFDVPSKNPDVAFSDKIIDLLVAEGVVDPKQIYVTGISNGGFFSQFYATARHSNPTPGGNKVAATTPYSAADPFQSPDFDQQPSCQLNPYPKSNVPISLISRNCDLIACSEDQMNRFRSESRPLLAPGFVVETWIKDLDSRVENSNVTWTKINAAGQTVAGCLTKNLCSYGLAILNHINWPDGINDNGGNDHEPQMLEFMKANKLP
jgi:hypothetical protein